MLMNVKMGGKIIEGIKYDGDDVAKTTAMCCQVESNVTETLRLTSYNVQEACELASRNTD